VPHSAAAVHAPTSLNLAAGSGTCSEIRNLWDLRSGTQVRVRAGPGSVQHCPRGCNSCLYDLMCPGTQAACSMLNPSSELLWSHDSIALISFCHTWLLTAILLHQISPCTHVNQKSVPICFLLAGLLWDIHSPLQTQASIMHQQKGY